MYEENYEKKMQKKKVKFDRNQMPRPNVERSNTNLEVKRFQKKILDYFLESSNFASPAFLRFS